MLNNQASASQALLVSVHGQRFALRLVGVTHVYPACLYDEIPSADPRVPGVVRLGRRLLPLIDLGYLTSQAPTELTADQAFVECAAQVGRVLPWVEEVGDVALVRETAEVAVPAQGRIWDRTCRDQRRQCRARQRHRHVRDRGHR